RRGDSRDRPAEGSPRGRKTTLPNFAKRGQVLRPGGGERRRRPHPRETAAGLPFERASSACPQSVRVLRGDPAGGSAGPAAPPFAARRGVQGGRGRQRRHVLRDRAADGG